MERDDPEELKRRGGWRRRDLARKWNVDTRTVDRMKQDGRLGAPDYFIGRIPVWSDETRQAAERRDAKEAKGDAAA